MKKLIILFIIISSCVVFAQETITFKDAAKLKTDRYGLASADNGKDIFAIDGGTFSFKSFLNSIDRFNPENNEWERIVDKLIPRRYLNAEYIPSLNKIYIFNGEFLQTKTNYVTPNLYTGKSRRNFNDIIEIVDLNTNEVTAIENNPNAVRHAGSAVWENKIYVFGGWNPAGFSSKLFMFDPAENKWTQLADMPEAKQTKGKIVDGILYTFGGYDNDASNYKSIHAYNIKENKWSLVGELPVGVSANAVTSDGKNIWIVGSYNNLNFLASFDTNTKTISIYNSNMIGRRHAAAQVVDKTLYVIGGNQTETARSALVSVQCTDISKYME